MEHTERDSKQFFDVMWKSLKEVLKSSLAGNPSPQVSDITNAFMQSIQKVKDAKRHMKDIWEESRTYRISDKIHMSEIQVCLLWQMHRQTQTRARGHTNTQNRS